MENSYDSSNGNGPTDNGHMVMGNSSYQPCIKRSLPWLDLRVFYVRVSKCEIDDSTPEYLTLNHIPLNRDTLLEVNGVRASIYSDGALELCNSHGSVGESNTQGQGWSIDCESDITPGTGFFKGKQLMGPDLASPTIEVYIAGSFLSTPIILTKTLQLGHRKKRMRKGMLDSIAEYEMTESQKDVPSRLDLQMSEFPNYKPENEDYSNPYTGTAYFEDEDGELSWFNAGVRVGVGIGLSICLGIGIGVGLLVRTYQGTTSNFRRRLL